MCCIYSIYTFLYSIHIFLNNIFIYFNAIKCKRLTSIDFGAVHSDRTVVVLLHSLVPDLALSLILPALSRIIHTLLWASLTLWYMSTIHSPSWSQLITSDCSSIRITFRQFFTCIALCNVDLHLSLMLVRKANAVEEGTKWVVWLYHQHNQSIRVTDGVAMMSLSASLLHKIIAVTDRLCQITLKGKIIA